MAIVITAVSRFKHLNSDPSYSIKPGGVGREREAIVDIAITDDYSTDGITLDFSTIGKFSKVYICNVIQGQGGLQTEYIPAALDDSATGKLKIYGSGAGATNAVAATGTIVCDTAIAGDTVTINGLVYLAVAGAKNDDTEFSIDTGDDETALDLADSIDDDVRVGVTIPSANVRAVSSTDTVTMTASQEGIIGNTIPTNSQDSTLTIAASTLQGGSNGDVGEMSELDNNDPIINGKTLRCAIRGI